jgi:enoyl-[acyl-carrier protein] reductase I
MAASRPIHVITGVANEASIAWAVAERLLRSGEPCLLASLPRNVRRAEKLLERANYVAPVIGLDVGDESSFAVLSAAVAAQGQRVASVLHAIAYARMEDLQAPTLEASREGFLESIDISVYSLLALVRALRPFLAPEASVVTLSYHGAQKCMPGYNIMGIAKAALESAVRYLAYELGAAGIRVNCASPGALLTLSSSAFPEIQESIERGAASSPLRAATRMEDVSAAVCFLLSGAAAGITGQVVYLDNGLSIMGG